MITVHELTPHETDDNEAPLSVAAVVGVLGALVFAMLMGLLA